jgi:hypothetical protein
MPDEPRKTERHRYATFTGLHAAPETPAPVWAAADERAAIVEYLRAEADAPHPIELGAPMLSPSGRGLLLLHADRIERGEHLTEEEP